MEEQIGRRVLFRFVVYSTLGIIAFFVIFPLTEGQSLWKIGQAYLKEFSENYIFVAAQAAFLGIEIWFIGGLIGKWIINKGLNSTATGILTIFTFWILLLLTCALTGGTINSLQYGLQGFFSGFMLWIIYGLIPFIVYGLVNGLIAGYFLGSAINKRVSQTPYNKVHKQ